MNLTPGYTIYRDRERQERDRKETGKETGKETETGDRRNALDLHINL